MRIASAPSILAALALFAACAEEPPPCKVAPATRPALMPPESASTAQAPAPPPQPDTSDDAAIAKASQDFLDMMVELSPEFATERGLHARDAELDTRNLDEWNKGVDREQGFLGDLKSRFASPKASVSAKTDLAILVGTLEADIRMDRERRPLERDPGVYASPMAAVFAMVAHDYAPAEERAKNVLARIEKIPGTVALARTNLKNPPRVWTQIAIEQAKSAGSFFDEQQPFLDGALPAEKARTAKALKAAKDAYAAYATFLEKDLLPRSTGNYAAGKDLFEFLLRENYFLDRDADQILDLGKRLFAETDAQMTDLAKKMDPSAKGWPEVTKRLKSHHPSADDLIPTYRTEVDRARKFLVDKDAVPFPPGDQCQVIETPPYLRSTTTAAYEEPPPFDPVTKGFFFVTPVDRALPVAKREEMLRENDHGDQVDTAVHETYPGHHLQLSFARLHPSLIRKATGPSIFSEGWGLYAEELMNELGYYTDEERMMQLEWTLVRAARVIIDVGLHTKGMTFDEAVRILTDQVHLEHELALSEVKRYTLDPTQPLAYLVGRELIFELRERYKKAMGDQYSLKKFHAEVLSHGTIAPGLIAREMFSSEG
jgi:uncharacterized protein (DUF885 family)